MTCGGEIREEKKSIKLGLIKIFPHCQGKTDFFFTSQGIFLILPLRRNFNFALYAQSLRKSFLVGKANVFLKHIYEGNDFRGFIVCLGLSVKIEIITIMKEKYC